MAVAKQRIALDQRNTITASRLATVFGHWGGGGGATALDQHSAAKLSSSTREAGEMTMRLSILK